MNLAPTVSFYILSAVAVFSAIMVVTQRNLFTCALYLAAALSMVGGIFVLLGADFLAGVQILLYVGGILVIIVFAVMFSNVEETKTHPQVNEQWIPALIGCLGILTILLIGFKKSAFVEQAGAHLPTTEPIAKILLNDMILPFEVVSLVLLASLVGAVLFSKKESAKEKKQ